MQKNINFILNSIAIIQRWSPRRCPREHSLKSSALVSNPTSPRKCRVCGGGQHYFLICKKWAKVMTFFFRLGESARDLAVNLRKPFFL